MGNQSSRASPDPASQLGDDNALSVSLSTSSETSLSSQDDSEQPTTVNSSRHPAPIRSDSDDVDHGGIMGSCSPLNVEAISCIPNVLTYYRKEDPLLIRGLETSDTGEPGDDDGNAEAIGAPPTSCAATSRRRSSWSPKTSSLSFFSKYSTTSSSTSSLVSLLSDAPRSKYTADELDMVDGHLSTEESDLTRLRDYFIITTAALPWMTGTAVNPLLRAAYLSQYQRRFHPKQCTVTLVIPWLESLNDRQALYGKEWIHKTQEDQEIYIRDWLTKANMAEEASEEQGGIRISFYPARYHPALSSIFPMGDLCEFITTRYDLAADSVLILEEPEHMHYFRAQSWRKYFCHVVGVIHTNYKAYASESMLAGSLITGPLIERISSWLVRAYCDQVIKLSPVLQSFGCPEKELVCNVHGIRYDFIQEGARRARERGNNGNKIYFLGKLLWAKGLDKLLELEALYRSCTGDYFPLDIAGSGPEQEEIEQAFLSERGGFLGGSQSFGSGSAMDELSKASSSSSGGGPSATNMSSSVATSNATKRGLATTYYSTFVRPRPPVPARFLGRKDHALMTKDYKIFVNPSTTEVLCTCTAEATAMGKYVIIPDHPSNTFFKRFPNCLLYKSKMEFVDFLQYAITHQPEPLSEVLIHQLTWEAATERFIEASAISRRDAKWRDRVGKTKSDENIAKMHYELGKGAKGDVLRKVLGGGPVADQFQYDCRMLQAQLDATSASGNRDTDASNDHRLASSPTVCV